MNHPLLVAAAAAVAGLALITAFAAEPTPEAKDALRDLVRACRPDAETFCAGVEQGGGRKLMCLRSHAAEPSPACKDGLAKAASRRITFSSSRTLPGQRCARIASTAA